MKDNKYIDITQIDSDNYKLTISSNGHFFQLSLSNSELHLLDSEIEKIKESA